MKKLKLMKVQKLKLKNQESLLKKLLKKKELFTVLILVLVRFQGLAFQKKIIGFQA